MTDVTGLHSRSILAGYDPERLRAGKVLVAGLGALGQNLVQNLALLGVGRLMLVDFDVFEGHNATRSPFFPTPAEKERFGTGKAVIVAHRAAQVSTAACAEVYYSDRLIQVLGDGAVSWADVVVAAVDSLTARAWLAERCRLLGKPMIEGGFSGPDFNLSAFAGQPGTVCYRCGRPERDSSMSCTAYALTAEAMAIVPAIQTSAAVLGGYQAEQVVQLLHGRTERLGYRSYGNVRRETLQTAQLPVGSACPGIHQPEPIIGMLRDVTADTTLKDLLSAVARQFGHGRIWLSEAVIPSSSCTTCLVPCHVRATESAWMADPRCASCGGPWPVAEDYMPDSVREISTGDSLSADLAGTIVHDLGLHAGACLAATLADGRAGLLQIDGDILACISRASPYPAGVTNGAATAPVRGVAAASTTM
jgi:molybdopterin/thiamine biosynthesis adenylyltransferase